LVYTGGQPRVPSLRREHPRRPIDWCRDRPGAPPKGIQAALLSARLADAAAAGCDTAVVTTQPASTSQHNVQRRGFDLLYTRAIVVKQL